jgi:hypothetical protein
MLMVSRANGFVRESMSLSLIIPPHPMQPPTAQRETVSTQALYGFNDP